MTVSIIIPVYNVERYITRCLESVASQTFKNIECILIDDCGTDNSISIASDFIEKQKKEHDGPIFKIVHHTKNSGLSAARNTGIKEATGDYLYFLDSDDSITPNCIKLLVNLANKYPDISFSQGNLLNDHGGISQYGFDFIAPEYINKKEELSYFILTRITTCACNRLIKKSFIIENSLFFPVGLLHEDMYWVYFVAKYANAAAYTSEGIYFYYNNAGSIMNSTTPQKRIARYSSRLYSTKVFINDIKEASSSNQYQRQYIAVNLTSCIVELSSLRSIYYWMHFWKYIISMGISNARHISMHRILFLAILLPPLCFIAGNKSVRWRIQERILNKI